MQKIKKFILPGLIVILALATRLWQYEYFPVGGETADETAWTLLGASLIQRQSPVSWSQLEPYKNYRFQTEAYNSPFSENAQLVEPALDHPPLFSLIPGLAHTLKGNWLEFPSMKVIRLPLVVLGTLNVALFWFVARHLFAKERWALVAAVLFATIPSIVWGSRLVVAENLLVTWTLAALLVLWRKTSAWTPWLLGFVCAAAVLTKMSGIVLPMVLAVYSVFIKKPAFFRASLIGGLAGLALFAGYGALWNGRLFMEVFLSQASRELGLGTLYNRLFLHPTLVMHIFFDGWKIAGLFATLYLLGKSKKNPRFLLIHLLTLFNLLFIATTVGEATFHGWYDIVLWPTLVLSLAGMLESVFAAGSALTFGFLWLLLLPAFRAALSLTGLYTGLSNLAVRAVALAGFTPLLWKMFWSRKSLSVIFAASLILLVCANLTAIFGVTHEFYWLQAAFFEPPR